MPRSRFVHVAREFGATGIWLPALRTNANAPGTGVCLDVSGYGRHAVPGVSDGWCSAVPGPDVGPAYQGIADAKNPFVATIPAIADPNTLAAHVYVGTTSERGSFFHLSSLGNRGCGIGVGGTSMDNTGNTYFALNDAIAFHSSGTAIAVGWHLFSCVFATGTNQMFMLIDDVLVSTQTWAGMSAGTTTEAHIAGYSVSSRATSCAVGTCAWFDHALTVGQLQVLARCSRKLRVAA